MAPKGGTKTPIDPTTVDRVAGVVKAGVGGVRALIVGVTDAWFGPQQPLQPVAPPDTRGRVLDYPIGFNLNFRPRSEAGEGAVDFATLRRMADPGQGGLDLLRIAIETRKDQMAALKWTIRAREDKRDLKRKRAASLLAQKKALEEKKKAALQPQLPGVAKALAPSDKELELPPETPAEEKARQVEQLLRSPDGVNTFQQWQRLLVEDLLVIDAPSVYIGRKRPGAGGARLAEVMDGALLKRLIDANGRTPLPPDPAFQQALKGLPAVDYTLDEIVYAPRNQRSHKIYGYSPTEQVITTINIALRRQLMQLLHYTEGNIPEAFIPTPDGWSLDQVKAFQEYWDSVLEGNEAAKRHAKFIPAGVGAPIFTHDPKLKDEFDEWLARVICWCFSLPPQALVKEMNRATAQTSKQTAQEEGLEPLKLWMTDLMDALLAKAFNAPELEFAWEEEEIADPYVKAQVFEIALAKKPWMRPSEVRERYGMEPDAELDAAPAPAPAPFGGKPPPGETPPEGPGEKVAKARRSLRPIERNRPVVTEKRAGLQQATAKHLTKAKDRVLAALKVAPEKVTKSAMRKDELEALVEAVTSEDAGEFEKAVRVYLGDVAQDGAREGLEQVGAEEIQAALQQANPQAIAWAKARAAELVTQVDDVTRQAIQDAVALALESGTSNDELAKELQASHWFSDARAETIARTETAFADIEGNKAGWAASGVVGAKQWITSKTDPCEDCAALDGEVLPLDEDFPDGDPPLHPRCECDLLPVLDEDEEAP